MHSETSAHDRHDSAEFNRDQCDGLTLFEKYVADCVTATSGVSDFP